MFGKLGLKKGDAAPLNGDARRVVGFALKAVGLGMLSGLVRNGVDALKTKIIEKPVNNPGIGSNVPSFTSSPSPHGFR